MNTCTYCDARARLGVIPYVCTFHYMKENWPDMPEDEILEAINTQSDPDLDDRHDD